MQVTITLQHPTIPATTKTLPAATLSRTSPVLSTVGISDTDGAGNNVSITVTVQTTSGTTFQEDSAFRVVYNTGGTAAGAWPISSVVFSLMPDTDGYARFDMNDGATDEVNQAAGGWSPRIATGGSLPTTPALQDPGDVTFTPNSGSSITLTVGTPTLEFTRGRQVVFGVDTDQVGPGGAVIGEGNFGVRIHGPQSVPVSKLLKGLALGSFGPYTVNGDAFALFPANGTGQPRIVNVVSILP
ncbi:MAG: hypothetical protein O3A29_13380 [Planctomycetota bacterium]|nr:hypothetical protein [Planctomycetota bacterium]